MNPELKAKWVAALRSGEFEQEREYAGKGKKLCCIGVGGYVAGVRPIPTVVGTHECAAALGLSQDAQVHLVRMNDLDGQSFFEIADWIEKNL